MDYINNRSRSKQSRRLLFKSATDFFKVLNEGVFWFAIFLSFIAISKVISVIANQHFLFTISLQDIIISSLGFLNVFLIKIINKINVESSQNNNLM